MGGAAFQLIQVSTDARVSFTVAARLQWMSVKRRPHHDAVPIVF